MPPMPPMPPMPLMPSPPKPRRGPNPESVLSAAILDAVIASGRAVLWRNTTGATRTSSGGFVRYGLCPGSADLVGMLVPSGRFLAVEVKVPDGKGGWRRTGTQTEAAQIAWRGVVERSGGCYVLATSVAEALAGIGGAGIGGAGIGGGAGGG